MRAFITGTDTAVGKTYATALLAKSLRAAGLDTVALKPFCSGSRDDVHILREACDNELSEQDVNPFFFEAPLAPLPAARKEGRSLNMAEAMDWFDRVSAQHKSVLVEGAGGWLVPVWENFFIADLAAMFNLPVIVVVANRLGCINHTLLTLESIRSRGLLCHGIILNNAFSDDESTLTNRSLIQEFGKVPVLFEIGKGQERLETLLA